MVRQTNNKHKGNEMNKITNLDATMELKEMQVDKISKSVCPIITLKISVDIKNSDMTFSEDVTYEVSATRFNVVLRSNHNLQELGIFTEAMYMNTNKSISVQSLFTDVTSFANAMIEAHDTLQTKRVATRTI
jgi:hypothetical protein